MKIRRGALIDLDGVLVDTAKYHYISWKRLAQELGFDLSEAENERLKGISRKRSLEILLSIGGLTVSVSQRAALAERKNQWYVERISAMDESELLPGAIAFLQELHARDIMTALGSASKNAPLILERLGIADLFDAVIDGNRVSKAKPNPEVFLLAAREIGAEPRNCFVVEDAKAGIQAAKAGGMLAVGIGNSAVLRGADRVFASVGEVDLDWVSAELDSHK